MDKIKKYKFIVVAIVLATMAIAPLTGCKIIKDAIGLADKEKSVEEPEIADPRKVGSSENQTKTTGSLGMFYTAWLIVLMFGALAVFIKKNKNRKRI